MSIAFIPILFFSAFWGFVGICLPIVLPKGPNQGLIRCVLMLTAATCWLFWLCAYLAQSNPLFGPMLSREALLIIAKNWGNPIASE